MSKEEIVEFKEELFKEMRDVEEKLNLQIIKKTEEIEEKYKKFIGKFNSMIEKHNSLLTDITNQNIYFDKINDLEIAWKKMDSILITHEIRINNSIKDIKDINFKLCKEISENLNVSGFIGPSCKYKTISNYLSSNINEVERIKTDIEKNKKEGKETKRKMEEIIKKVLNLVDSSNTKCIEYTEQKSKNIEEIINSKIGELTDKILSFKSLIMSQEKIKDIYENLENMIRCNNYNKLEIDDMLNDTVNNIDNTLQNFKTNYNEEISNIIKLNVDKLDNDIKENNISINDIKLKLNSIDRIQNQLMRNTISIRNTFSMRNNNSMRNTASMKNIFNNHKNNEFHKNNRRNNLMNLGHNINEEEKINKFKNLDNRNNIFEAFNHHRTEYSSNKDKYTIQNKNNKTNPNTHTNINSNNKDSIKIKKDKYKYKSIKNKSPERSNNSLSEDKNELNVSKDKSDNSDKSDKSDKDDRSDKSDISYNKNNNSIENEINSSPYKTNSINNLNGNNKKYETKRNKKGDIMIKQKTNNQNINKNENIKNLKKQNNKNNLKTRSHKNISNLMSFNKDKKKANFNNIIHNIETIETETNNDKNSRNIEIINDNTSLRDNKSHKNGNKTKGFSIHKLASVGLDENVNDILPNMNINTFSYKNMKYSNRNSNSTLIKNVFPHNNQLNLKHYKMKQNLTLDAPVKITSSFGRTGYAFYDKKEEAIQNLINKGIKKKMKEINKHSNDLNFEFSPVSKIKLYDNL